MIAPASKRKRKQNAGRTEMNTILKALPYFFSLILVSIPHTLTAAEDPNEQCMTCHEDQSLKDNAGRALFVDRTSFGKSIHGRAGLNCISCHADLGNVKEFPHPEKLTSVHCSSCHEEAQNKFAASVHMSARLENTGEPVQCGSCHGKHDILETRNIHSRSHPLNQPQTCGNCHFNQTSGKKGEGFVRDFLKSVHGMAISRTGLSNSATCVTCHGSHEIKKTTDPSALMSRRQVPNTCGQCHSGILNDYTEGVHGQDFAKGIRDVPVCTDCHGEHNILSPQDKGSKVYSTRVALTCAKCHDDDQLIQKYNLPRGRLRTFQGTFHGIASSYGDTKVANCASCHGFHSIRPSSDPSSSIHPANLPQTCGQCHTGAGERLSRVKIHVLDPKAANYAGYVVGRFYFYLIAFLVGSFIVYILADLKAQLLSRHRPKGEE